MHPEAPPSDGALDWRTLAKRVAAVVLAGAAIYLVLPSIARVFSSFPKLSRLNPIWFCRFRPLARCLRREP